jgi:hypothetical protein
LIQAANPKNILPEAAAPLKTSFLELFHGSYYFAKKSYFIQAWLNFSAPLRTPPPPTPFPSDSEP